MYQLTLEITDTKLEQYLRQVAKKEGKNVPEMALFAIQEFLQRYNSINESTDPWENPNIALPSIDTGITDFARHHDHYLYNTEK